MNLDRRVLLRLLPLASLLAGGCAGAPLATFGTPKSHALSASRLLVYPGPMPGGQALSERDVANAVAQAYVAASRYGALRAVDSQPESISIGGDGVKRGPMTRRDTSGVRAQAAGGLVNVSYVRGVAKPTSGEAETTTRTMLMVKALPGQPGHFRVESTALVETIRAAPGLGPVGIAPLAPPDQLADDVAATLAKMAPRPSLTHVERVEVDVAYPVQAVFANYERVLGRASSAPGKIGPDERAGRFALPRGEAADEAVVTVMPYRNGSRVVIALNAPYEVREDGGATLALGRVRALAERLRQIAGS